MRRVLALALGAALLVGCAQPRHFYKDGATRDDYLRDVYPCAMDGKAAGGAQYVGWGRTERTMDFEMVVLCMASKGWVYQ